MTPVQRQEILNEFDLGEEEGASNQLLGYWNDDIQAGLADEILDRYKTRRKSSAESNKCPSGFEYVKSYYKDGHRVKEHCRKKAR